VLVLQVFQSFGASLNAHGLFREIATRTFSSK